MSNTETYLPVEEAIRLTLEAVNGAATLASKAPYADIAHYVTSGTPAECNARMYALILGSNSGTAWNLAKTGVTNAIKRKGFVWGHSGPHYSHREDRKVPFTVALKSEADAAKKAATAEKEALAAELEQQAVAARASEKAAADASTTAGDLARGLLAECQRLGIDPSDVMQVIATMISPAPTPAPKRTGKRTATKRPTTA